MVAPARYAALRTLQRASRRDADLASAIEQGRRSLADERDRALLAEIVIGTMRWRGALDHVIAWAGARPTDAFDEPVLAILRLSAYQLLHLDRVPAAAVVDDAVNLCKAEGFRSASGAVNAILRRISRERSRLPLPGPDRPLDHLSITWSHPAWLVERWIGRFGVESALEWVRFNNAPAPVTIRPITASISRQDLAGALAGEGVETRPCRYAPDGLQVDRGNPLQTALWARGLFAIQDEASQLVGAFLAPARGARVVDACASPGGKTAQLADALGGTGVIVACDVRPRRVRLLHSALRAWHLDRVRVVQHDLMKGAPFTGIDVMLVDAPCSGLGTLRRDPDIRWKRSAGDLADFAARQGRMLDAAAAAVRPGGCLIYSTCSSEPDENDDVVRAFLERQPGFVADDPRIAAAALPEAARACLEPSGFLRTSPPAHGLEAFFAARLRRRA